MTGEVLDAVEVAAGSDDDGITEAFRGAGRRTVSARRLNATRNTILRFLQNVPEGMTALEIREAIENGGGGDDDA